MEEELGGDGGEEGTVCSLCGDVGFSGALRLCNTCRHRHQHMYCSRFYPNVDVDKWSCEWCIHEEEQRSIKRRKVFECLLDIAQSIPDNTSSPPPPLPPVQPSEDKHQPLPQYTQGAREKKRAASETKNVGGGGGGGGGKALERWKSLAARGRFGCRRYKLLADVLC